MPTRSRDSCDAEFCPTLTVSLRVSLQETGGETVAETDPRTGAARSTYRDADRGSKTTCTMCFVCNQHLNLTIV